MFKNISSAQLLAVTRWSRTDLDNRAHAGQLSLAHGLVLPTETDKYIGLDAFALMLSDKLVEANFTRAVASRCVREGEPKWTAALEQVEWPDLFPPPVPTPWAPTPPAIAAGHTEFPPDVAIYLAIARKPDGDFQVASGTQHAIMGELFWAGAFSAPAPVRQITTVDVRVVYDAVLDAAAKAGVDLGAPFTRPEQHPEHKEWYAAVAAHRALSLAREKTRKVPGPRPGTKSRAKAKVQRRGRAPRTRTARVKVQQEQA